jgi:Cd2+/Zn2+-exporting ATPase
MEATTTNNRNLVLITRQFIWMEFFAQRVYQRLGQDLLEILEPEDRHLYGGMAPD